MKVSIITVCRNSAKTIQRCINSVAQQTHPVEHLLIDGNSTDSTIEIAEQCKSISRIISEPDKGIYDAMNKGIKLAGGDIIGFLNADDLLADQNCVSSLISVFGKKKIEAVFGNVEFFDSTSDKSCLRRYATPGFKPWWLKFGIMPPHLGTYLKRSVFQNYGNFKLGYKIAADYEFFVRIFYKKNIEYSYLNKTLVKMQSGGISNKDLYHRWLLNHEIIKACMVNKLYTNWFYLLLKIPYRLAELNFTRNEQND